MLSTTTTQADDFEKQVYRTFENILTGLKAAGATNKDVVRLRMYIVNLDPDIHVPIVGKTMNRFFADSGPASTMIGVQTLAEKSILFEADVTAVIP